MISLKAFFHISEKLKRIHVYFPTCNKLLHMTFVLEQTNQVFRQMVTRMALNNHMIHRVFYFWLTYFRFNYELSVHISHWLITVFTASSIPSGGYLCLFSKCFTNLRIPARALSFFCQSMVRFLRSVSVSSL